MNDDKFIDFFSVYKRGEKLFDMLRFLRLFDEGCALTAAHILGFENLVDCFLASNSIEWTNMKR